MVETPQDPEPQPDQDPDEGRYRLRRGRRGGLAGLRAWFAGLRRPVRASVAAPEDGNASPRYGVRGYFAQILASPGAEWTRTMWRGHRWFRLGSVAVVGVVVLGVGLVTLVEHDLPSADSLLSYQPPLPTMVRGNDGSIVYSYARERRVQLRYVDFPPQLIHAFLSAEDKNFFTHGGVDFVGLGEAVIDNVSKIGSNERGRGGSTITQQVAKNMIGNERSLTRKFKEMVLARRIESVMTKQQILEIYLNMIPLGRQSFGAQAAARAYFGKDVGQLSLAQSAFLAILPKEPEKLSRAEFAGRAIERRNWVLDQMVKNRWVDGAAAAAAKAEPLGLIARRVETYDPSVAYFVEEVRRFLLDQDQFGEDASDGPNSVYAGGLWVRTSLDPAMQKAAQDALSAGLMRYNGARWYGPIAHVNPGPDWPNGWQGALVASGKTISFRNWRVGIVLNREGSGGAIGFADGGIGQLVGVPGPVVKGDIVAASPSGGTVWAMHPTPGVSGGMMVEQPFSGRVLALAGGFDMGLDSFDRATQAERQPGSSIKPFVYATALDNGMTPATMVPDQSLCVYQGSQLGQKCFKNFGNEGGGGIHTMRWGLEQSRNLMTVHIANDIGMDKVVKTIKAMGIGDYAPYLSYSLGAGETTVAQMVNAYSALADQGLKPVQSLIDYIQDRNGKIIWRADTRKCVGCNLPDWDGKPMPRFAPHGTQAMDARTAFQVEHMLEGVVQRGTAASLNGLGLPLFGKTGTTTGPTNVWFVGGSPNIIAGTYIGYDVPRSLGAYAQGATYAVPIFRDFLTATASQWDHTPFVAPAGVSMQAIDRQSGQPASPDAASNDADAGVIWEAFKPETQQQTQQAPREQQVADKRQELLDELKRGFAAMNGHPLPPASAPPADTPATPEGGGGNSAVQ